nr:polysaccharide deacetylase family protein [Gorillibacterium massiliense]
MSAWKRIVSVLLSLIVLSGFAYPAQKHDRTFYEKTGEIIWEVPQQEKKIALTFDDGPSEETTGQILDLLKEYHAKATFFVVGNRVMEYPDMVKRELSEGHEIGNHTFSHYYLRNSTKSLTFQNEILNTEKVLVELTGMKPHLFRPPGGYYNEQMVHDTKKLGYTTILWSWHQDTNDWRRPGVRSISKKVITNARNGDIVLLHDYVPGSNQTVKALKVILPELTKEGFQFVTVSELISSKQEEGARNQIPLY